MNIKDQLREFVADRNNLIDEGFSVDENFLRATIDTFVDPSNNTYKQLYDNSYAIKEFCLAQHGKFQYLKGALENLHSHESIGGGVYKKQRMHYAHQAYVFLLGIYLYEKSPKIRDAINSEMRSTSKMRNYGAENFQFSGNSERGEFLFRWRLASLSHDLGYIVSLLNPSMDNYRGKLAEHLQMLVGEGAGSFSEPVDMFTLGRRKIFSKFEKFVYQKTGVSLPLVNEYILKNPLGGCVIYDHGIMSSIAFLHIMNREFSSILEGRDHKVMAGTYYHESFLVGCFQHIAMSVALHGLDAYFKDEDDPEDQKNPYFKFVVNRERYLDYKNRPFNWLLKICDMLQEWDKPAREDYVENEPLDEVHMCIDVDSVGDIFVSNFPKKKVAEILNEMTSTPANIRIELEKGDSE